MFGPTFFLNDIDTLMLEKSGTYTLLIEGTVTNTTPIAYAFAVYDASGDTTALTLNATTAGAIDVPGEQDRYTFSVAGSVGLLLSDLWAWHDGTNSDRQDAIGFGRGLQAVNILRNHKEDLVRGVSFMPHGWTNVELDGYARRNLALAEAYTQALPKGPARDFCALPLALAQATLDTMTNGLPKLSRLQVMAVVTQVTGLSF